ncbi:MAG TPA: sulfurtransferase TusA family protein [Acidimicrobiales bacterium]|nr:sulfurtransferase TusA family protein [Acidimicrobiales bacterium]
MSDIAVKDTLDVRGMACPMPVVKTKLAIGKLETGDVLRVLATDRGALKDIPAWAEATGNTVVSTDQREGEIEFLVEKG